MSVGQMQQMIQRQPLCELAELVASGGAYQAVQVLPEIAVLFLLGNPGQQGLLARAAVIVIFEAGAVGAQLLGLLGAFGLQLGNLLGNGFGCFVAERLCLQCGQAPAGVCLQGGCALCRALKLVAQCLQTLLFGIGQQGCGVLRFVGERAGLQRLLPFGLGLPRRLLQLLERGLCLACLTLQPGQLLRSLLEQNSAVLLRGGGWRCTGGGVGGQIGQGLAALQPVLGILCGLLDLALQQVDLRGQLLHCLLLALPLLPFLLTRI